MKLNRKRMANPLFTLYIAFFLGTGFSNNAYSKIKSIPFTDQEIETLVKNVKARGWDQARKKRLFSYYKVKKIPDMIKLNVTSPQQLTHSRYAHFLNSKSLLKAFRFGRKWRHVLTKAEEKYKVDKETILGILLVETQFGNITGSYPVISVFASTYIDATKLSKKNDLLPRQLKRAKRKAKWALGELQSLLKIRQKSQLDILNLKGSYAGAFGMSQFLPSSYLSYAVKYKGAKAPDLFYAADAIHSVAHYLARHGYRKGSTIINQKNQKAVHKYNHSNVYVDTVLGVANSLKQKHHKLKKWANNN